MFLTACSDSIPNLFGFVDTSIAPPLLFYSYIPAIIISLFLGFLVAIRDLYSGRSLFLLAISLSFAFWTLNELSQWLVVYNEIIMFSWEISAIFGLSLFYFSLFFIRSFIYQTNFKPTINLLLLLSTFPVLLLVSTKYNIGSYDLTNCEGIDFGPLWIYIYVIEIIITVAIVCLGLRRFRDKKQSKDSRQKALLATLAITAFLALFSFSGVVSDLTGWYRLTFLGPAGMVIFLGLLSYMIVQYRVFRVRMLATQVLVGALWVMVGSLLFVAQSELTRLIVAVTEIFSIIFGIVLIRSVKREVAQRERIEVLLRELGKSNDRLWVANARLHELDRQKTEFVSMASHQLRSPLTSIKGYSSMLLEGSFGELAPKAREAVDRVFQSSQNLVTVIEDFLNISRIELGTMHYEMSRFDFCRLAQTLTEAMRPTIEKNGLHLSFECDPREAVYQVEGDSGKLEQVLSNLIDNASKYTKTGGTITVCLTKQDALIRLAVKDTGIGIPKEIMPKLFKKFSRSEEAGKVNIRGTGLGLFVAKEIVEAHHGRIWAESEGEGRGSTFVVELAAK